MSAKAVRERLQRDGVLLKHDARWPSLTTIVAGEPVRGSWWGHAAGHAIFAVLTELHDEVAFPKLLGGKVTLVHRRLWPALAAVGRARETWQLARIRDDAEAVLELVDAEGSIATDDIELPAGCRKISAIATDLERRLLLASDEEHSDSGKHVRVLQTWARWSNALGRLPTAAVARQQLGEATLRFGGDAARELLPWP